MYYRNGRKIYSPASKDQPWPYTATTYRSINEAKAQSRHLSGAAGRIVVQRGLPPEAPKAACGVPMYKHPKDCKVCSGELLDE